MVTCRGSVTALGPARVPPDTKIASCCLSVGEQGLGSPGGGREMSTLAHQSGSKLLELETKFQEVFKHYAKPIVSRNEIWSPT